MILVEKFMADEPRLGCCTFDWNWNFRQEFPKLEFVLHSPYDADQFLLGTKIFGDERRMYVGEILTRDSGSKE